MVKDAEQHAAEDRQRKELIEARNQAESLIHSTQKSLTEVGDKVPEADKSTIEAAIADLKSVAAEGEDVEAIKAKTNEVAQVAMKLGEALYREQQPKAMAARATARPTTAAASEQAGEDVVDAEFEEVKDEDRKSS
jgi:molecular chaperone DnaK